VVLTGVTFYRVIETPHFVVTSHFDVMRRAGCPTAISTLSGVVRADERTIGVLVGIETEFTLCSVVGTDR
jgi:hypothetical protein